MQQQTLKQFFFTYRRLERKTVLLPYFFFTMLMHSYFYVLITTVFYPFNCYKGNNIYGEEIRRILLRTPESRSQFILMDRIQPKLNKNILVRQDTPVSECIDVIPELGIVGIIIRYVPSYRGEQIQCQPVNPRCPSASNGTLTPRPHVSVKFSNPICPSTRIRSHCQFFN